MPLHIYGTSPDDVVLEPQLLECLYRLMVTTLAKAMDGQRRFAGSSGVSNGLCRSVDRHLESVSCVFLEQRVYIYNPLLDVVDRRFSHFFGHVERDLGLIGV
jgi:hypothetical protein